VGKSEECKVNKKTVRVKRNAAKRCPDKECGKKKGKTESLRKLRAIRAAVETEANSSAESLRLVADTMVLYLLANASKGRKFQVEAAVEVTRVVRAAAMSQPGGLRALLGTIEWVDGRLSELSSGVNGAPAGSQGSVACEAVPNSTRAKPSPGVDVSHGAGVPHATTDGAAK
jgi:hypothetical protein